MFSTKKKIAALGVSAVAVASAGIAGAYWTTTGTGEGSGATTAGVDGELDITQSTVLSEMFPGDTAQTLTVNVANPSDQSVYVADVSAYLTVTESNEGTCDAGDFLLGGNAAPGAEADAISLVWDAQELAKDAADDATTTIQFNNLDENQDACKGATVTINYLAS